MSARKAAFASFIGTMIEWYDFFVFGTAAALIFNELFFTSLSPVSGTLAAFATFGVGFLARPIGGLVFGHFGDRLGRKKMLVTSLLMMGAATVVIGLLPTYQSVGLLAPLLLVLCRLIQGLAVGGEWGGAVLMSVEHAPPTRRAFYGSWPQMGAPVALILAAVSFWAVQQLPGDQFLAWGWRIPFLASVALIIVGLFIRLSIAESPSFQLVKDRNETVKVPLVELVRTQKKPLALAIASTAAPNIPYYITTVFVISYLPKNFSGISPSFMMVALGVASACHLVGIPTAAILADRYGRKVILMSGALFMVLYAFPFFWLLSTNNSVLVLLGMSLMLGIGHAMCYAPQSSFMSELFHTRTRYTGVAVAYNIGAAVTSGPVPLVAGVLVAWAGGTIPLVIYIIIAGLVTGIGLVFSPETIHKSLESENNTNAVTLPEPSPFNGNENPDVDAERNAHTRA